MQPKCNEKYDINFNPDDFIYYTKNEDRRHKNDSNFNKALESIKNISTLDVKKFKDRLIKIIPKEDLERGEKIQNSFSLKFHLWGKNHPLLLTVLKVLSLGVLVLINRWGMKQTYNLDYKAFTSMRFLNKEISDRKLIRKKLIDQEDHLKECSLKKRAQWVSDLQFYQENEGDLNKLINRFISQNVSKDLDSSDIWIDEEKTSLLKKMFDYTSNKDWVNRFNQRSQVVQQVGKWDTLSLEEQLTLVQNLKKHPKTFKPQLNAIIQEVRKNLNAQSLLAASSSETLLAIVDALAIRDGRELIQKDIFEKQLSETFKANDPQKKESLKNLCQLMGNGLVEAYRYRVKVHAAIRNEWKTGPKKHNFYEPLLREMAANEKAYSGELNLVRDLIFNALDSLESFSLEEAKTYISELCILDPVYKRAVKMKRLEVCLKLLDQMEQDEVWENFKNREIFED